MIICGIYIYIYMHVETGRQKNDKSDNNNNEECTVLGVCEWVDVLFI